jgi:hypothetical protein
VLHSLAAGRGASVGWDLKETVGSPSALLRGVTDTSLGDVRVAQARCVSAGWVGSTSLGNVRVAQPAAFGRVG